MLRTGEHGRIKSRQRHDVLISFEGACDDEISCCSGHDCPATNLGPHLISISSVYITPLMSRQCYPSCCERRRAHLSEKGHLDPWARQGISKDTAIAACRMDTHLTPRARMTLAAVLHQRCQRLQIFQSEGTTVKPAEIQRPPYSTDHCDFVSSQRQWSNIQRVCKMGVSETFNSGSNKYVSCNQIPTFLLWMNLAGHKQLPLFRRQRRLRRRAASEYEPH